MPLKAYDLVSHPLEGQAPCKGLIILALMGSKRAVLLLPPAPEHLVLWSVAVATILDLQDRSSNQGIQY